MDHTPIEKLPTDRAFLHFEAVRETPDRIQVDYELVIPLKEADCRGTFDHKGRKTRPKNHRHVWLDEQNNRRIPMGRTNVGSTNPDYPFSMFDGSLDIPFRDGAHQYWDNEMLGGLPVIYSKDGNHWVLTPKNPKTEQE